MEVASDVIIRTKMSEICLCKNGILKVTIVKEDEVDLEEVQKCFAIYKELGCDKKKVLQLMNFNVPALISKEAREYIDEHAVNYFIASAMVTQSLAVRLIINFCMKFFRNKIPLKLFSNEKDALKWLRSFEANTPEILN